MPDISDAKDVLSPDIRKTATLLGVIAGFVAAIFVGIQAAERFIDGRIDLRLASTRQQVDEQERKIDALEKQITEMRELLIDIRADVRVLRTINEQRKGL
jgi:hypothetical protein